MGNKIYRELLGEYDIKERWYVLSSWHNLPPIRAERLYKAYRGAREEILILPVEPSKGGVLRCELVVEDDGGAPDAYFDCTIIYPADDENYAVDFIDWAEIVNCAVDGGCLQKYGALVVTAEILWEITFYGYSRATVNGEGDKLKESVEEITAELESDERERHTRHADDFLAEMEEERERRKNSGEEKAFLDYDDMAFLAGLLINKI